MTSELLHQIRVHGALPRHVAIIMDGNGRWAQKKGLPRQAGHSAGMKSVREVVEGAVDAGIEVLTLFAFSTENWQRPGTEISALMGLLEIYARKESADLARKGVEVHVLGELDRVAVGARRAVDALIDGTRGGTRMRLNLMISYGAREEIVRAAQRLAERVTRGELEADQIDDAAFRAELFTADVPDPDLLIRTSGEYRLSNFLLWQLAYTELHITQVLWPDFTREDLYAAVHDFQRRERRFGRVKAG
jgi:undecaprenyl diphosphate synthase